MQLQALTFAPSVGMFPGISSSRPAAMLSVVGHDDRRNLPTCVNSAFNFKREDLSGMTCGQQTCSLGAASQHTVLLHHPAVASCRTLHLQLPAETSYRGAWPGRQRVPNLQGTPQAMHQHS
jgi:hypothetical protein